MGLLDQVIKAALATKGQPAQGQTAQSPSNQDQFAQIAAALTALLAEQVIPQLAFLAPERLLILLTIRS